MAFTRFEKDVSVHQSLSDEPNADNGLSAEELKKQWDRPAEELKEAFNKLVYELESKTSATDLGANPLTEGDTSEPNIDAKLRYLLKAIQDVTLGTVPDGSITKTKLDGEYTKTLAVKDGTVQVGLNAEKIADKTLDELASYFMVTGALTGISTTQFTTFELGFTPRAVLVSSGGTRVGIGVLSETELVTTEKPQYYRSDDDRGSTYVTLEIVENGFKFRQPNHSDGLSYGTGYRYIAFR